MVQVQIRVKIQKDGALQLLYEILPREGATEEEISIAKSLESSFREINRKAAEISGVQLQEVKISGRPADENNSEEQS